MIGRSAFTASRRALLLGGGAAMVAGCAASGGAGLNRAPGNGQLTARLADTGAIREIKRLQHIWGHLADSGQWADMGALFADDGVWSDGTREISGRSAIIAMLRNDMGHGQDGLAPGFLNIRLFLSPVITIAADGNGATGRWHEVAMTGQNGVSADWAGGIHVIDYVRTMQGWKIRKMVYHPQYAGPYDKGWNHVQADVPLVPYHYTPDQAGKPVPHGREEMLALPEGNIAARADLLLAASAVQNLQAAYGFYLDRKLYSDIVDLATDDAIVDVAGVGIYRGKAAIRRALEHFGAQNLKTGELNDRPQLMPVINVGADGNSASLRNYEIGMTGDHAGATYWSAAIQEFEFARGEDGVWRIAALRRYPRMRAAYEQGWAKPMAACLPTPANGGPDAASALARADYPQYRAPRVEFPATLAVGPAIDGSGDPATKIDRALAYDGAENIGNAYGYYIDEFRWDETADLFSTDGWKELSYIGTYIGRENVRESLVSRYGRGGRRGAFMAIHQKTQPFVTVSEDGQQANIRLRLFQFNSAVEGAGSWISGIYENQAIVEDGIWRIHGMDLDYVWLADYTGGWAAIVPGSSARYAPDPDDVKKFPPQSGLRGVTFAPFPEVAPMGFHFLNPVSKRAPATYLTWSDGYRPAASE